MFSVIKYSFAECILKGSQHLQFNLYRSEPCHVQFLSFIYLLLPWITHFSINHPILVMQDSTVPLHAMHSALLNSKMSLSTLSLYINSTRDVDRSGHNSEKVLWI